MADQGGDADRAAAAEAAGHLFYVSIRRGTRVGLLAGPLITHAEALGWVEQVKATAHQVDPWSGFDAFGTCSQPPPARPGRLNALLGLPTETQRGTFHVADARDRGGIRHDGLRAAVPDSDGAGFGVYVWHGMRLAEVIDTFVGQYAIPGWVYDLWRLEGLGAPLPDPVWPAQGGRYPHDVAVQRLALAATFSAD